MGKKSSKKKTSMGIKDRPTLPEALAADLGIMVAAAMREQRGDFEQRLEELRRAFDAFSTIEGLKYGIAMAWTEYLKQATFSISQLYVIMDAAAERGIHMPRVTGFLTPAPPECMDDLMEGRE